MSDNPPRFADFGKSVKDLLFPAPTGFDLSHSVKLESKARKEKDIKFNADWTQKPDQTVSGKLSGEWAHSCGGTVKATVATDNVKTVDASYKNIVPGLVLNAAAVQGAQNQTEKPDSVSVGARYFRQYVDSEVKVGAYGPHTVEAAAAFGARGFFAGAKGVVALDKAEGDAKSGVQVTAYDLAATYQAKEFEVVASAEKKLSVFKAGFLHHVTSVLDVAAQVEYKKACPAKTDDATAKTADAAAAKPKADITYIVGASVKHDGATIKGRLDSNGILQGSYSAPVHGATVTLVGRVSTIKRDAKENGIGLQVALK